MADVHVYLRNRNRPSATPAWWDLAPAAWWDLVGDAYFVVLEFNPDCFYRWIYNIDDWYKLPPRVPIEKQPMT